MLIRFPQCLADVFLLFDDTGSFRFNSPIVRAAFPNIIAELESRLPGIDLGFGVDEGLS